MQARKVKKIVLATIIALLFVSTNPVVQASESNVLIEVHLGEADTSVPGDDGTDVTPPAEQPGQPTPSPPGTPAPEGDLGTPEDTIVRPPTIQGAEPSTPGRLPQTGATVGQVSMLGILIVLIGLVLAELVKEDKQKVVQNAT